MFGKKPPLHYLDAVHYQPMENNHNVRCLNGSAHVKQTRHVEFVTCELCKNPLTNKEYWHEKQNEKLNKKPISWTETK